jgi:hypothetical protein
MVGLCKQKYLRQIRKLPLLERDHINYVIPANNLRQKMCHLFSSILLLNKHEQQLDTSPSLVL